MREWKAGTCCAVTSSGGRLISQRRCRPLFVAEPPPPPPNHQPPCRARATSTRRRRRRAPVRRPLASASLALLTPTARPPHSLTPSRLQAPVQAQARAWAPRCRARRERCVALTRAPACRSPACRRSILPLSGFPLRSTASPKLGAVLPSVLQAWEGAKEAMPGTTEYAATHPGSATGTGHLGAAGAGTGMGTGLGATDAAKPHTAHSELGVWERSNAMASIAGRRVLGRAAAACLPIRLPPLPPPSSPPASLLPPQTPPLARCTRTAPLPAPRWTRQGERGGEALAWWSREGQRGRLALRSTTWVPSPLPSSSPPPAGLPGCEEQGGRRLCGLMGGCLG
jgi:hypothetical protein